MDQAYSFNAPKVFTHHTLDHGTTVTALTHYLGVDFHKGTLAVQIQNTGADYVYWSWGAVELIADMGRIPVDGILRFNWEEKDLNQLYVAGDSVNSKIVVLQEGK